MRSAGIDTALVITGRGGRWLDTVTGATLTTVPTTVDVAARSFVVRVPRAVLPAAGAWRVRLGSELATADGTGVAPATGAPPGAATRYNLGIRDRGGGRADVYDARGEHRWSGP